MKKLPFILCLVVFNICYSQDIITTKLGNAMRSLQLDKQFEHSLLSMYVVDTRTGKVIYAKNEQTGMAPASCQKIVTSVSGFELLGNNFSYKTKFVYLTVKDSSTADLYLSGDGDPTFGSWRWNETSEDYIFDDLMKEYKKMRIKPIKNFIIDDTKWGTQTIPGGWPWEDIGQYYGSGCNSFTWHENQYNIVLKPGKKIGDSVIVLSESPLNRNKVINELTTGPEGSGDQVYVYTAVYSTNIFLRGTVPLGVDSLTVAASSPDGRSLFHEKFWPMLDEYNKAFNNPGKMQTGQYEAKNNTEKVEWKYLSPSFDSMNYWFLKKSINLYGEAFVKTIAYEKRKTGSTDSGVSVIRDFWSNHGIEKSALKIIDGSGLSPANRLTTKALVTILQYAKRRPWFSSFYLALPEMNGIKMKDGYIGGVRSYTGYVKSATGAEYSFAFIVNNFDGAPSAARQKMWKVLDLLK